MRGRISVHSREVRRPCRNRRGWVWGDDGRREHAQLHAGIHPGQRVGTCRGFPRTSTGGQSASAAGRPWPRAGEVCQLFVREDFSFHDDAPCRAWRQKVVIVLAIPMAGRYRAGGGAVDLLACTSGRWSGCGMRDSQKAHPSRSDGCVGSRFDISIGARRIANMRFVWT